MDPQQQQQQQLTGVVIISLPPPDNPSLGKTITAFTLSDPIYPPSDHAPPPPPPPPPLPSSPPPSSHADIAASSFVSTFNTPRRVLTLLAAALLVLFLYQCLFSDTHFSLHSSSENDNRNDSVHSFLFDLYPKSVGGFWPDAEVKLGSFVRRERVKRYRKSANAINSSTVFTVAGNVYPDGLYYASILVGNPARPYYLDMDTGSDLTWIQCDAPCTSCAKGPHPFYKPTKGKLVTGEDSLCQEVQSNQNDCKFCPQCDYEIEYADQSASMGVLARDEVALKMENGTSLKPSFVFGCAYDQQGQLSVSPANTDGILGLSRAKVSLPSQLASQGIINNVVGHCITSDLHGGGYLFLGDDFTPRWGMTWVPMLNSPYTNFYNTELTKISLGGERLSVGGPGSNAGRVIFDSGSSYTYFTKEAYTSLITSLKDSLDGLIQDESDSTLPVCWRANFPVVWTVKNMKQFFKPLTLHFGNRWLIGQKTLQIPPEGYLIRSNKGNICLGILDGSKVHDGSMNILGDISLGGQLVVYDNVKRKIGWVQSDCIKPRNFKSFSFF
ncbi:aspartyl protease APCB1 [Magnolia sinica]|uniref:aspartyl protease APCB1 n=1 Tax=Magnolia sinica TaxID=86752 RepID=UPI002658C77B|nr:aspartyl protease APCB1 [Magnolia sinica]